VYVFAAAAAPAGGAAWQAQAACRPLHDLPAGEIGDADLTTAAAVYLGIVMP
jgi:hypothetical protein